MDDAQYSGLSPQSVVAVVQRSYKYMHFPLRKVLLRAFRHASVEWKVNTSIHDVAGFGGRGACCHVINHLDVSIYL